MNETLVAHLQIWNSLINILPNDMFAKVTFKGRMPRMLIASICRSVREC